MSNQTRLGDVGELVVLDLRHSCRVTRAVAADADTVVDLLLKLVLDNLESTGARVRNVEVDAGSAANNVVAVDLRVAVLRVDAARGRTDVPDDDVVFD